MECLHGGRNSAAAVVHQDCCEETEVRGSSHIDNAKVKLTAWEDDPEEVHEEVIPPEVVRLGT